MATRNKAPYSSEDTLIFLGRAPGEILAGFVASDNTVFRVRLDRVDPIGRAIPEGYLFQRTTHDERLVGHFTEAGAVHSVGLLEGGAVGWLDPDGVVVQGGLIFGEEEVGRVAGPQPQTAAAALLLIFLPEQAEANRQMQR